MTYLFVSLSLAMVFGIAVTGIYGTQALLEPWVDITFRWIIGVGMVLATLNNAWCFLCRLLPDRVSRACAQAVHAPAVAHHYSH
jgi:cytochrome c biogenesis protein CcdA